MKIVGIDPSLSSTGVAVVSCSGREVESVEVATVTSKPEADVDPLARLNRMRRIVRSVMDHAVDANAAVIEGPSYGSVTGRQHDRSGLWWMLVRALTGVCLLAEVPPASRTMYATGRGNASKDTVLSSVIRRYPDVEVAGNDQADALVLAAMGARWWGIPIEISLPATHTRAMDKVAWPVPVREVDG